MTPNGCAQKGGQCPTDWTCIRGSCDQSVGRCICPDHFAGRTCDECSQGWTGQGCAQEDSSYKPSTNGALGAFRIIIIVVACLLIVSTVAFLLYRRYFYKGTYQSVGMQDMELEQEDDHDSHSINSDQPSQKKATLDDDDNGSLVSL